MDTPIISPWIFYLIDVLNSLIPLCMITTIGGGTIFFIGTLVTIDDMDVPEKISKFLNISKWITIISLFLLIFIPTKETLYKMIVANYITPANLTKVGDTVENSLVKLSDIIVNTAKRLQEVKK